MRSFLAVNVPEPTPLPGLRPAPPEAPRHFTLRFLGEVDAAVLAEIGRALAPLADRHFAFPLTLSGLGAFPDWRRPRIVFVAASEGRRELVRIAQEVDEALAPLGFREEGRPFVPHVTVLRVRSAPDRALARRWADLRPDEVLASSVVRELLLKESELTPSGARHRVVGRYPLAEAP